MVQTNCETKTTCGVTRNHPLQFPTLQPTTLQSPKPTFVSTLDYQSCREATFLEEKT